MLSRAVTALFLTASLALAQNGDKPGEKQESRVPKDKIPANPPLAPEAALGGNFLNTAWPDVATALQVSAYSLKSLAMAAKPLMSGGHDKSALGVASGDYDMAGVASDVYERMVARGTLKGDDFRIIYKSPVFPTSSFAYTCQLTPEACSRSG